MKDTLRRLDIPLLIITIILLVIGLVMIFSASSITAVLRYGKPDYYFFAKQLVVAVCGIVASFIIFFIPTKSYNFLSIIGMIAIFGLLFALRIYGETTNNATSWFSAGIFGIQPSEFSKTIIILYLATVYGNRKRFKKMFDIFIWILPCIVIFGMICAEPDFGTASIIALICIAIVLSLPIENKKLSWILFGGIVTVAACAIIFIVNGEGYLSETQLERFTFSNPCERYLEDTGYQVCNGYIAIHNGGLFGLGLGNSTQKFLYLPEAHTDFIFPIIVEELGLIGGSIILILYIVLLFRILVIARNASSLRGSIIAFGTFALILVHICINLGGVLALIPLTGVPLPFLSYGGSNLINVIILVALTQRVAIETSEAKYHKEVKKVVG